MRKFVLHCIFVFIAFVFAGKYVYASQNISLNEIDITSNNNKYQISIKTDNETKLKTYKNSKNNIVIGLKNTKPSDNVITKYENITGIKHIILKQEANNLLVEVNGNNVAENLIYMNGKFVDINKNYNTFSCIGILCLFIIALLTVRKIKNTNKLYSPLKYKFTDKDNKLLKSAFASKKGLISKNVNANKNIGYEQKIKL